MSATPGEDRPLLLAVDGDGLLHRAFHAGGLDRDGRGRPVWAVRGLMTSIASAAARLRPDAVLVAFDCRGERARSSVFAGYKAHRPARDPDLDVQLSIAAEVLGAGGVATFALDGHEGDDVLASAAASARRSGWRCTVASSDRDSFALLDETTSVLRVVNGGVSASPLMTPADLFRTHRVRPDQYRDYAALRGDPSDNLDGVKGVGPTLAARLLGRFGSCAALFAALTAEGADAVADLVGPAVARRLCDPAAREVVERNRLLMAMRDDLPVPAPEALRLPLDRPRLTAALAQVGIRLTTSLWALVGDDEPAWEPTGFDRAPAGLPAAGPPPPWAVLPPPPAMAEPVVVTPPAPDAVPARTLVLPTARPRGSRRVETPEDQLSLF